MGGALSPSLLWLLLVSQPADPSYEGRLRVPAQNYSLQITSLRAEDTGTHRAQIITATGIVYRHFTLRVYKRVLEPTIVCDTEPCVNGTCHHSLACIVRDGGGNVTYSWTGPAGGAVLATGPILHMAVGAGDAHLAVTCTAQNPASHSSATVSVTHLCAAAQAALLSYCHAKGLVLLLVLGALGAGILAVHVLGRQRRWD